MWRFAIALIMVVLAGSIILGQVFNTLLEQNQTQHKARQFSQEQQTLLAQVKLIRSAFDSGMKAHALNQWLELNSKNEGFNYKLQSLKDYPLPSSLLKKILVDGAVFLESNEGLTAYSILTQEQVLLVTQTNIEPENLQTAWLFTLIFYSTLLVLILLFLAPFLLRLYKLRTAAVAIGNGQLDKRLKVGSLWYLKDIEMAFNQMAEKLGRLMQDIKLLSGGLSHELRTHLARVRMGLDTLCETDNPEQKAKFETRINQNLDDMEALIHALLHFARLQNSLDNTAKTEVDLNLVLKQQVEKAYDPRCKLIMEQSPCFIQGDKHYLSLLMSNLLNNALKHARQHIEIQSTQDKDFTTITVSDDGEGIADTDKEKVFKPFVRLAKQANDDTSGYGVGLALVERIVSWLGGQITIETTKQLGGACFIIRIPRRQIT
ncbi:ATP-binding protein [Pseudoalteromonas sp. MTN2-4]|uniref:ATP-binding protein n=1 Tax=Pseudoalteromonas sp. MTN2-4 TaxID=3056555 RepID=UPI0036F26049